LAAIMHRTYVHLKKGSLLKFLHAIDNNRYSRRHQSTAQPGWSTKWNSSRKLRKWWRFYVGNCAQL